MIPAAFDYQRPATIDEALRILGGDGGAKVLAGGQSLLPLLKLRLASADRLVDIGRIAELKGVRPMADGRLAIGAMTTYRELLETPARDIGVIADAIPDIADLQTRNRGTVGGAIAHADPASDLAACLLALGGDVVARSARGERSIAITDFFKGAFETELAPDEILTEVRVPGPGAGLASAYCSLTQMASGYPLVGVAAVVTGGGGGSGGSAGKAIGEARIAITGVGEATYRASGVERGLAGSDGSASTIVAAAAHATEGVHVRGDIHADPEYRTAMAEVYARRSIQAAVDRLSG